MGIRKRSIYPINEGGERTGKWRLDITYEGGKRSRTTHPSKKAAQARLKELEDTEGHVLVGGPERAFEDYVRAWQERQRQGRMSAKTVDRMDSTIRTWIIPTHGKWGFIDHRIGGITDRQIVALYATMRKEGRAERTVHKTHEVLGRILRSAVRDRWIKNNPMDSLEAHERPGTARQRQPEILSHKDVWRIFHAIRDRRGTSFPDYSLLWLTVYYQGTRVGEALPLTAQDFDFDRRQFSRENFKQKRHTGPRGLIPPIDSLLRLYVENNNLSGEDLLWPALGKQRVDPEMRRRIFEMRDQGLPWVRIAEAVGLSDSRVRLIHKTSEEWKPSPRPASPSFFRQEVWGPVMAKLHLPYLAKDLRNSCVVNLIDGEMTGEPVEPQVVMHHVDHKSLDVTLGVYYRFRAKDQIGARTKPATTEAEAFALFDPTLRSL